MQRRERPGSHEDQPLRPAPVLRPAQEPQVIETSPATPIVVTETKKEPSIQITKEKTLIERAKDQDSGGYLIPAAVTLGFLAACALGYTYSQWNGADERQIIEYNQPTIATEATISTSGNTIGKIIEQRVSQPIRAMLDGIEYNCYLNENGIFILEVDNATLRGDCEPVNASLSAVQPTEISVTQLPTAVPDQDTGGDNQTEEIPTLPTAVIDIPAPVPVDTNEVINSFPVASDKTAVYQARADQLIEGDITVLVDGKQIPADNDEETGLITQGEFQFIAPHGATVYEYAKSVTKDIVSTHAATMSIQGCVVQETDGCDIVYLQTVNGDSYQKEQYKFRD